MLAAMLPWGQFNALGGPFGIGFSNYLSGFTLTAGAALAVVGAVGALLTLRTLVTGWQAPAGILIALVVGAALCIVWGVAEVNSQTEFVADEETISSFRVSVFGPATATVGAALVAIAWRRTPGPTRLDCGSGTTPLVGVIALALGLGAVASAATYLDVLRPSALPSPSAGQPVGLQEPTERPTARPTPSPTPAPRQIAFGEWVPFWRFATRPGHSETERVEAGRLRLVAIARTDSGVAVEVESEWTGALPDGSFQCSFSELEMTVVDETGGEFFVSEVPFNVSPGPRYDPCGYYPDVPGRGWLYFHGVPAERVVEHVLYHSLFDYDNPIQFIAPPA